MKTLEKIAKNPADFYSGQLATDISMDVKEAGGITNDISKFNDNNINIRAASSGIFEKMMEKLGNF